MLLWALGTLVPLSAAAPVHADERAQDIGKQAVRRLLRDRFNERVDLRFDRVDDMPAGGDTRRVVGSGDFTPEDRRRHFDFTIAVRPETGETRDAEVRVEGGQTIAGSHDWTRSGRGGGRGGEVDERGVRIISPTQGERIGGDVVNLVGTAARDQSVDVAIYDGDRRLRQDTVMARAGRWGKAYSLPRGEYRVVAAAGRDQDEVRFAVQRGGNRPDRPDRSEDRVQIDQPTRGQVFNRGRFDIAGTAKGGQVRVQVFTSEGRRVTAREFGVRGGRWEGNLSLPSDENYRMTVSDGQDTDEVRFSVRRAGGGSNEDHVKIDRPTAGETIRRGSVDVGGTALGGEVRVQVFTSEGRRVLAREFDVRDGRWGGNLSLPDDQNYRMTVADGRDTDEVRFSVRRGGGGNEARVQIDRPSAGQTFARNSFDVGGTAEGGEVRVQIFAGNGERVLNRTFGVRNGRWGGNVSVPSEGNYRMTVADGRDTDEVRFRVRR